MGRGRTPVAIRLARILHAAVPEDPEVTGLLALMLLTDARRPARSGSGGKLIPLAEQDRTCWDRDLIAEGMALITGTLGRGHAGAYQVQERSRASTIKPPLTPLPTGPGSSSFTSCSKP
jgi:predicted RNA polymerase sigma factor